MWTGPAVEAHTATTRPSPTTTDSRTDLATLASLDEKHLDSIEPGPPEASGLDLHLAGAGQRIGENGTVPFTRLSPEMPEYAFA